MIYQNVTSLSDEDYNCLMQWLIEGKFTKNGMTYQRSINDDSAIRALIPKSKKVTGKICHITSLTLMNGDMDWAYHDGLTIGNGKTLYWHMIWHSSGHVTVYSRDNEVPRWLDGDTEITVHFK